MQSNRLVGNWRLFSFPIPSHVLEREDSQCNHVSKQGIWGSAMWQRHIYGGSSQPVSSQWRHVASSLHYLHSEGWRNTPKTLAFFLAISPFQAPNRCRVQVRIHGCVSGPSTPLGGEWCFMEHRSCSSFRLIPPVGPTVGPGLVCKIRS